MTGIQALVVAGGEYYLPVELVLDVERLGAAAHKAEVGIALGVVQALEGLVISAEHELSLREQGPGSYVADTAFLAAAAGRQQGGGLAQVGAQAFIHLLRGAARHELGLGRGGHAGHNRHHAEGHIEIVVVPAPYEEALALVLGKDWAEF